MTRPRGIRTGALELERDAPGVRELLRALPARLRLPAGTRVHATRGRSILLPRAVPGAVVHEDRTTLARSRRITYTQELRPAQRRVVAGLVKSGGGVVVAPCGSGKTEIGLAMVARWGQRALVLVGSLDLRQQWMDRARARLRGAVVSDTDDARADVVVLTIQGLARKSAAELERMGAGFGALVLDEGHHGAAPTWSHVILHMPARYRVALTATLERTDELHGLVTAHFGATHRITEHEMRATGATLLPRVRFVLVDTTPDDPRRDAWIARLMAGAVRDGRRVLVLVRLVEHAFALADACNQAGCRAAPVVGAMSLQERTAALTGLRQGHLRVLVATSVADEGLDLPELDTVVLASSTTSLARVQQRVGRALRPLRGKKPPLVYDLVDRGGEAAALKRERRYRALGYPVVVLS